LTDPPFVVSPSFDGTPYRTERNVAALTACGPDSPSTTVAWAGAEPLSFPTRTSVPTCRSTWSAWDVRHVARNDCENDPTARASVSSSTAPAARDGRRPTSQAASGATSELPRAA